MEKCITLKILKKLVIKVNLETIKWRVKVNLFLKTNFMKVCLKKIFSMVKESQFMMMKKHYKVNGKMVFLQVINKLLYIIIFFLELYFSMTKFGATVTILIFVVSTQFPLLLILFLINHLYIPFMLIFNLKYYYYFIVKFNHLLLLYRSFFLLKNETYCFYLTLEYFMVSFKEIEFQIIYVQLFKKIYLTSIL